MKTLLAVVVLLLLPVGLLADEKGAKDEKKKSEKARFAELVRTYKDVKKNPNWDKIKIRRDTIVGLAELDHKGVPPVLYEAFTDDREQVCRIPAMIGIGTKGTGKILKAMATAAVRDRNNVYTMCLPVAFAKCTDEKFGPWFAKKYMNQTKDLELKAATIQVIGAMRVQEAWDDLVKILGKESRDVRIAYETMIALGRIGGSKAIPLLTPYFDSKEKVLRLGAVEALGETDDPSVVDLVTHVAKDEFPRAQEAVAEVILRFKAEDKVPVLVDLLRTKRLRVMDTASRVLAQLSGEDYGIDADAWELWFKKKQEGTLPEKRPDDKHSSIATYYGMKILSDRVLFILDVSGSMKYGEPPRIDVAREELKRTIDQLNKNTWFNVVGFAGSPMWWQDEEVQATKRNVEAAKEFVEKLSVGGGTNVYNTFEEALEKNQIVDTIYFLGDGSPSVGKHTEQEEILARVRWMNRFRKVKIHVIALLWGEVPRFGGRQGPGMGRFRSISDDRAYDEEEAAIFMARLSAENDGTFLKKDK